MFLTIMAVIPAFFGALFFLTPERMLGNYGFVVDAPMKLLGYSVGSMLIAIGALNLLSRNFTEPSAVRVVLSTNIVVQLLTGAVDAYGTASGAMNSDGWGAVAMHAVFLLGFAYYLFVKKETPP
jgi:hypothetical protein